MSNDVFKNLDLTADEKEILCNLKISKTTHPTTYDETLKAIDMGQLHLAGDLAEAFETGSVKKGVPLDKRKAEKYRKKTTPSTQSANAGTQSSSPLPKAINTENTYWLLGYFSSVRLFLLRANRIFRLSSGRSFLPSLFSIGGLSYGIELLIDIGVVLYSTFRAPQSEDERQSRKDSFLKFTWQRFKNVMLKDGRVVRMINAALWFSVNLTAFIITGGLSSIINIAGFGGDVGIELYKAGVLYRRYSKLDKKLGNEIEKLEKRKQALERDFTTKYDSLKNKIITFNGAPGLENQNIIKNHLKDRKEVENLSQEIIALDTEIEKLGLLKAEAKKEGRTNLLWQIYPIITTVMLVIGMALIFFPPAAPVGMGLIGASIALGAGSIFAGLGKRLFLKGKELIGKLIDKLNLKPADAAGKEIAANPAPEHDMIKKLKDLPAPVSVYTVEISKPILEPIVAGSQENLPIDKLVSLEIPIASSKNTEKPAAAKTAKNLSDFVVGNPRHQSRSSIVLERAMSKTPHPSSGLFSTYPIIPPPSQPIREKSTLAHAGSQHLKV